MLNRFAGTDEGGERLVRDGLTRTRTNMNFSCEDVYKKHQELENLNRTFQALSRFELEDEPFQSRPLFNNR